MKTAPRIALVTGATMAKPDPETHLLDAALAELGIDAPVIPWDAPEDWAAYPLVVVRTPWDDFRRLPDFLAWAESASRVTTVVNPVEVIRWNSHKGYLRELPARGVATVSIGAIGALKADSRDPACLAHLAALLAEGDVLVQPFIESVAAQGEVSLIYFGGAFSHAIRKRPAAGDYRVQDMYGGTNHAYRPAADEVKLASRALTATPAPTTYARVDLVRLPDGEPRCVHVLRQTTESG